jgi:hypothetical protein
MRLQDQFVSCAFKPAEFDHIPFRIGNLNDRNRPRLNIDGVAQQIPVV